MQAGYREDMQRRYRARLLLHGTASYDIGDFAPHDCTAAIGGLEAGSLSVDMASPNTAVPGADSAATCLPVSLQASLASVALNDDISKHGSIGPRLALGFGRRLPEGYTPAADRRAGLCGLLPLAPPVCRASMVPTSWGTLNPFKRWFDELRRRRSQWVDRRDAVGRESWPAMAPGNTVGVVDAPDPLGGWQHLGNIRRLTLLVLMLAQTILATYYMSFVLPYQGSTALERVLLAMFAVLFCWISAGFWTAMTGFLVLVRGKDIFGVSQILEEAAPLPIDIKTAIVMPICNEDVSRVMAGLRATYESIGRSNALTHFDFFVLSDSNQSDVRVAELAAWANLCRAVDGFGRIFYRHRKRRVKRKSGNLDDFCRRWGKQYRYMIVLDADSVMSGDCVTNLVRLMEGHPSAGIIQTSPIAAGRETLYSRIQQFSTRVYGPLFTAGLHYWQLGESHYWGHNAIIRVAPFMRHCALAALPGRGSLAGEILSHDFVEAALMRRAGWAVWIAYDLEGSYEEMPSSLLEELKRDRRWCHGNLMNFRLFTARGMHRVHRAVFATGVMAYLSAPLWLAFLIVSTGLLAMQSLTDPQYFVQPRQLFPIWPEWHPEKAVALFTATATLLFLPKLLAVFLICLRGAREFGGRLRVIASMCLEMLFSMLLAPVRMMFHTRFVAAAFLGWALHWKSPPRGDAQTYWSEALGKHGVDMLLGIAWTVGIFLLNRSFLPWLIPIAGGLILSAPISIMSSRVSLGQWCRSLCLFIIPEEMAQPVELVETEKYQRNAGLPASFVDAVVDPVINALACAAGRAGNGGPGRDVSARAGADGFNRERAVHGTRGAADLSEREKNALLDDTTRLSRLHLQVWSSPEALAYWEPVVP
ncbi:MAG: glucans biosynthesis glucosyltransferase MdoH [Burkholderiaceae bacterium]